MQNTEVELKVWETARLGSLSPASIVKAVGLRKSLAEPGRAGVASAQPYHVFVKGQ